MSEESSAETAWRDALMGSHKDDWEWVAREMYRAFEEHVGRGHSEEAWGALQDELTAVKDEYWALEDTCGELEAALEAARVGLEYLKEHLNAEEA